MRDIMDVIFDGIGSYNFCWDKDLLTVEAKKVKFDNPYLNNSFYNISAYYQNPNDHPHYHNKTWVYGVDALKVGKNMTEDQVLQEYGDQIKKECISKTHKRALELVARADFHGVRDGVIELDGKLETVEISATASFGFFTKSGKHYLYDDLIAQ